MLRIMAAKELHEKEYKSDHEVYVLDKVNRFREDKKLCDVIFKVEKEEVYAHRNILAGFSEYFEEMFLSESNKSFPNEVEIKGVQAPILSLLITFIYTAVITINSETVYQIYETANMLQIKYVDEYCVNFLRETLNVGNCIGVHAFAQKYQISELLTKCKQLIGDNFERVITGLEFKDLTFDESEAIFTLKPKQKCCEETMFRSILNWIKHDFENRQQFFERLFQLVDVTKLSTKFLRELSQKSETWLMTSKAFVNEVLPELFNRLSQLAQGGAKAVNEVQPMFMVVGGEDKTSKLVSIYDKKQKQWRKIKSTLDSRDCSTIVKINNHVYTAGGWDGGAINTIECINLNQVNAGWRKVASMVEERYCAASAVLHDCMYTVGGFYVGNTLSSAEVYNPATNTCSTITPMKTKRREHALVSCNGRIYAFGGKDRNPFNSMECFDPKTGKWEILASMNEKRYGLSGVVCNDDIYAIGGIGLNTVERYNVRTNQWSDSANLNYERYGACACVMNGKIYVLGGVSEKESTTVEVYDPVNNEWKIETNMDISRKWSSVVAF